MSELSAAEDTLTRAVKAVREVSYRLDRLFKGCGVHGRPDGAVGLARIEGLAQYCEDAATARADLAAAAAAYAAAAIQAELDPSQRIADVDALQRELDRVEAAARSVVPA